MTGPNPDQSADLMKVLGPPFQRVRLCVALRMPVDPRDVEPVLLVLHTLSQQIYDHRLKVAAALGISSSAGPDEVLARIVELRAQAERAGQQ